MGGFESKLEVMRKVMQMTSDFENVSYFLSKNVDTYIRRCYIRRVIRHLVEQDSLISVYHDGMSESKWASVCSDYDTPVDNSQILEIRLSVQSFTDTLLGLVSSITGPDVPHVAECFHNIVFCRCESVQFVLFKLLSLDERAVLNFFANAFSNGGYVGYLVYFVSIIVRYKLSEDTKSIAVNYFVDYVRDILRSGVRSDTLPGNTKLAKAGPEGGASVRTVVVCQAFLYLCCFNKRVAEDNSEIVEAILKGGYMSCMNKDVVSVFCQKYCCVAPVRHFDVQEELINYFPMDKSPIPRISNKFADLYIEWNESY